MRSWPAVSVVMPVLDESRHLAEAVGRVLAQDYPGEIEVVLALGPSGDGSDAIAARLRAADARVRTVPNPAGNTSRGLNTAIAAARHDIIVRVDGHGLVPPDYVRTAVDLLERTGAGNVGGVMRAVGSTRFEEAVACAMNSPLGVGNARFHVGGAAGPVDTVYLGTFRRETVERLGGYDESLARAQDWELNLRIRRSGGTVWFSPRLSVGYRPRPSLRGLARQYFDSGRWRRALMRRHPGTAGARYLAAPITLVAIVGGMVVGGRVSRLGYALPAGYAAVVVAGSWAAGSQLHWSARLRLPVVIATMHLCWAAGFLAGRAAR